MPNWVVLPVIMVLGLMCLIKVLLEVLRIANAIKPKPPVMATCTLLGLSNGSKLKPANINATKNKPSNKNNWLKIRCLCLLRSIKALVINTVRMNKGIAASLIQIPAPPFTHAAPANTKLPVTCAVKKPNKAIKPMVSIAPPTKVKIIGSRQLFQKPSGWFSWPLMALLCLHQCSMSMQRPSFCRVAAIQTKSGF